MDPALFCGRDWKGLPMKQGDKYMKVIMLVLTIVVASYVIYNLLDSISSGVQTVQAVEYTVSEGVSIQGVIVRDEAVIPADFSLNLPLRNEGEKVAAGAEVALSLKNTQAQQLRQQLEEKQAQLATLEESVLYGEQLTDSTQVRQQLHETLSQYAAQVAQGRIDSAGDTAQTVKALVLHDGSAALNSGDLQRQLAETKAELEALRSDAALGTSAVTTTRSGYYSQAVDGYEALLTPDFIMTATADQFQQTVDGGGTSLGSTAGRLIASSTWYYAGQVPPEYLKDVSVGDELQVTLDTGDAMVVEMTVERADQTEGLIVLSSSRYISQVSALRSVSAEVEFRSYSGLRVPKEAVCYDGEKGTAGVYVLVNREADWKSVTLLYDAGDVYIALLDQSSTANLWPEDLILTKTRGLFDGKVVN